MNRYTKALNKRWKNIKNRCQEAFHVLFATKKGKFDKYVITRPTAQNALNIFQDEWISSMPPSFRGLQAGQVALFEDSRITWALEQLGGIQNKKILELGPLEGGHTYLLQKHGAASITSIEANPRAYLRCLIVKEIMQLDKANFLCGDFMEYLRYQPASFDICIASGVLYHMKNPVELIALAAKQASQLFIWTHYYNHDICKKNVLLWPRFSTQEEADYEGFKHTLYRYQYKSARSWNTFCGGPASTSHWLTRSTILECCRYFGLDNITISHEIPDHPHGPSFALVASKKKG